VLLERDGDRFRAVGTDGRHLLTRSAPAEFTGSVEPGPHRVIPRAGCRLVADLARADESTWEVGLDACTASFRADRYLLTTRLVEGRFPRWRDVFPTTPPLATVRFAAAGPLRQAARQAAVCAGTEDESTWIDLTFTPGVPVAIHAAAPDVGAAWADAYPPPESYEGEAVSIALMPDYLLGALAPLADDAPLELRLYGPRRPAVIEAGAYRAAVMPVTSDRSVPARPAPVPAEPAEVPA
jgi:DNA polymerase-3 subunit beta